jgi:L-alanine-DL-glutamate epimerase-like enolase superfamily enzyme
MKISGDLQADQAHINAILQSAPNAKIRLDANNFWSDWGAAFSYLQALRGFFWAVEEPLQTQDFTGMEELAQRLDCRIILDESCLTCADLERPSRNPSLWVVNVRVSKMGGVLRSIEVVQACTQAAIPVIVGAQVGETSLLTRAALTVVHANKAAVLAQEGAFGVRLLEHDIAQPCLMFGEKGNLQPAGLSPRGWGLSVQMPGGAENVPIIGA